MRNDVSRLKQIHPSGRYFIETYDDCQKRFTDLKLKREYRFVTHPLREAIETKNIAIRLIDKVYKNIEERERKGINQG